MFKTGIMAYYPEIFQKSKTLSLFLLFLCFSFVVGDVGNDKVNILFDTDFATDCDDAGALAILHRMADLGEARILGMALSTSNPTGASAMDVINHYYGRPDIPIGVLKDLELTPESRYTDTLTLRFPHDTGPYSELTDATEMYRRILARAPDSSVTFAVVGFTANMAKLLKSSADSISPLNGVELVRKKVIAVVVMGGVNPGGDTFNFNHAGHLTKDFLELCPVKMVFSGKLLGREVLTGAVLSSNPELVAANPVASAYYHWTGPGVGRPSWDLTAVYYAVRGLDGLWGMTPEGCNSSDENGWNTFVTGDCEHYYLTEIASDDSVARVLDNMMLEAPLPDSLKGDFHEIWPPLFLKPVRTKMKIKAYQSNRAVILSYHLDQSSDVSLDVFDAQGHRITELFRGKQSAGQYTQIWYKNSSEYQMGNQGIFFIQIVINNVSDVLRYIKTD
ncbi:MAG: hypothetical protein HQK83_03655 [Fibrobacteria bacterium]|nr:hypothetical protein [Fibrobacteria bacterium]